MPRVNIATSATACLIAGLAATFAGTAYAESYPSKPVTLIVPFSAGGGADIIARTFAKELSSTFSQPVIVENRAGAGGEVGVAHAARSAADGYTVLISPNGPISIGSIFREQAYNVSRDLAPVAMVSIIPFVLAVNAALPVSSLAEFIAYAKANPNAINYGNPGNGTVSQLNTEFLRYSTGINMTSVPYKGISQAALAVASGDVQAGAGDFASYSPLGPAGSGKVRFLAMFSHTRAAIAPNIPTISEAGIPDYKPVVPWIGMFVPANTPKEIVARLNRETQRIVQMPHVRDVMLKACAEPALMSVEQFSQYVANEGDDARKRVKAAGIKIE